MKKKVLAMLLALCMVLSMLPVSVFAAPIRHTAQISAQPQRAVAPDAMPELPAQPNAGDYKITARVEEDFDNGLVELYASSADAGETFYMMVDPDPGYRPVFNGGYSYSEHDMVITYIGLNYYEIQMPDGDVEFVIGFYEIEGDSHSITVNNPNDYIWTALADNITSAKAGESVFLLVEEDAHYSIDPFTDVSANCADFYYMGTLDDEGKQHIFELIMPDHNVTISISSSPSNPGVGNPRWEDPIALNETKTVRVPKPLSAVDPGEVYFSQIFWFTPEESGTYCFLVDYVEDESDPYYFTMDIADAYWELENGCMFDANAGETYELSFQYPVHDGRYPEFTFTVRNAVNPVTVTVETGLGGYAYTYLDEACVGDVVDLICVPQEGYRVAQITGVDDLLDNGDGTYSFVMPDEPVDLKVLFLRNENPFLDINETQFFYDSVLWAFENGITDGVDDTHFGPAGVCNRAQVVTFLWSAAGKPAPTLTENPFVDIPEKSWYTDAVLWAFEKGITAGSDDTHFNPAGICNRAQVVTFLYKAHGSAEPTLTENPFTDVPDGSWYAAPVLWAYENGITGGTDATHFNPGGQCLRAFAVTFLHKADQIPTVYPVNAQFDETMGTVTLSHTEAQPGEVITATVIPAEGYELINVHCVNDTGITVLSDTEFSFVMPEHEETFVAVFAPISEPDPVKTYELDVRDDGHGTIRYVDDKRTAAPGESIFFYAIPDPGYALTGVGVFNPYNEIDVSRIQLYSHENDLYELVMIDHDIILNCHFTPVG